MQDVPECPQCDNAGAAVEEWVRISHDGSTSGSVILTCEKCGAIFKPDGEPLTISSAEEMQRDGTPQQYHALTEIEKQD
jgi:hypothetical protein